MNDVYDVYVFPKSKSGNYYDIHSIARFVPLFRLICRQSETHSF